MQSFVQLSYFYDSYIRLIIPFDIVILCLQNALKFLFSNFSMMLEKWPCRQFSTALIDLRFMLVLGLCTTSLYEFLLRNVYQPLITVKISTLGLGS